jgi:hypothetical protein
LIFIFLEMAIAKSIEATAAFLNGVKDHPNYVDFRAQQSSKILVQIRGVGMTMEAGALLIETMKQVDWSPAEFDSLQAEVMNSVQLCLSGSVRKCLQDYTALAAYLKAETWDELLGTALSTQAKLERLLTFAHQLGLSNPTESTYQFLCAVFLLATEGQKAVSMQPCMRFETLKMIKKVHKSLASKLQNPVFPHLQKLPSVVQDLEGAYPSEFAKLFGLSAPVPSRLSWSDISICATGTPMRNSSKTSQLASAVQMLGSPGMTNLQNVPALLQGLANVYGNTFPHVQPQLPLTILSSAQSKVQTKIDNRLLALPSQTSLQPSAAIMDTPQPQAPAVSAPALTHAANPPAAIAHGTNGTEEKPKVSEKSVDDAARVVMDAMAAKSAAAAAKAAADKVKQKKKNSNATKGKATKGKAAKGNLKDKCKTPPPVAKAAKGKNKKKRPLPSDAERLKMRPSGCSKCRRKPGCTPSCFK